MRTSIVTGAHRDPHLPTTHSIAAPLPPSPNHSQQPQLLHSCPYLSPRAPRPPAYIPRVRACVPLAAAGSRSATSWSMAIILAAKDMFSSTSTRLTMSLCLLFRAVVVVLRARVSRVVHTTSTKIRPLGVACVGSVWSPEVILGCFDVYKPCTFAWCMWFG